MLRGHRGLKIFQRLHAIHRRVGRRDPEARDADERPVAHARGGHRLCGRRSSCRLKRRSRWWKRPGRYTALSSRRDENWAPSASRRRTSAPSATARARVGRSGKTGGESNQDSDWVRRTRTVHLIQVCSAATSVPKRATSSRFRVRDCPTSDRASSVRRCEYLRASRHWAATRRTRVDRKRDRDRIHQRVTASCHNVTTSRLTRFIEHPCDCRGADRLARRKAGQSITASAERNVSDVSS